MTNTIKSNGTDSIFELLVQSVTDYAIYMLDTEGRVSSWNAGAERFKGYAAAEIMGEHFSRFYTDEERAAGVPARRARNGQEYRPLRGGRLASTQRRVAVLGYGCH